MGMRVGGSGSSAAMAAWQSQSAAAAPAAAAPAAAAQSGAAQQVATAMSALATGTTVSKMV